MAVKKTLSRKQRFFNKINLTTDDEVYVGIDVHKKSDFGGASPTLLVYSLEIGPCWFLAYSEAEFWDCCEDVIEDVGLDRFVVGRGPFLGVECAFCALGEARLDISAK